MLLLVFILPLAGCSTGDEDPAPREHVLVPIEEVEMADSFVMGVTYTVVLTYSKPTRCHTFSNISYDSDGSEFTFGVVTSFDPTAFGCLEEENLTAVERFNFVVERNDFYIFRFWQGTDENEDPIFLTKEIPVSPA